MPRLDVLALVLAAAPVVASAPPAHAKPASTPTWICAYAQTTPVDSCFLHSSDSRESYEACEEAVAKLPQTRPRFRVARGPWVDFPDTGWRCVEVPRDRASLEIENRGVHLASWPLRLRGDCRSHVLDIVGPNDYGAMWTKCSNRDTSHDQHVTGGATSAP